VIGRIIPNFLADKFGPINLLMIMCAAAGVIVFALFGAASPAGLIVVTVLFGICQGAYASLIPPAIMRTSKNHTDIGKRMGITFLCTSIPALTGNPITGALLDRFGYYAPITVSGVVILAGSALLLVTRYFQQKVAGTWRV
jgi:predicted MFS family arabinose efflux permease